MMQSLILVAAWLALPVALVCVIDDWFLRPRRLAAVPAIAGASPLDGGLPSGSPPAGSPPSGSQLDGSQREGPLMKLLYGLLPLLVLAAVYRMLTAERADFSLVLVVITALSGIVWALDTWLLRPRREAQARAAGRDPALLADPGTVDYARSFFPVAAVLLVLRSFLFEPYRIPSDSMMPTLLDGDFIVVNKFAYGLRLPVTHEKFYGVGEPARGDVVVFRYPPDPSINYIKRVVGLPGDRVQVRADQLVINGAPVPFREIARFGDGCYLNMRLAEEQLGDHRHQVLHCLTQDGIVVSPLPGCNRDIGQGYVCNEAIGSGADSGDAIMQVPAGSYLMIGDNRDNSQDGRWWGFVDEKLLVGKATRIWFNWDLQRSGGPAWSRVGERIQ